MYKDNANLIFLDTDALLQHIHIVIRIKITANAISNNLYETKRLRTANEAPNIPPRINLRILIL